MSNSRVNGNRSVSLSWSLDLGPLVKVELAPSCRVDGADNEQVGRHSGFELFLCWVSRASSDPLRGIRALFWPPRCTPQSHSDYLHEIPSILARLDFRSKFKPVALARIVTIREDSHHLVSGHRHG